MIPHRYGWRVRLPLAIIYILLCLAALPHIERYFSPFVFSFAGPQ